MSDMTIDQIVRDACNKAVDARWSEWELWSANFWLQFGFSEAVGDALAGREIRFVENFKGGDLDTYAKMATCSPDALADTCKRMGTAAGMVLRRLLAEHKGRVTFLGHGWQDIGPRIDSIQQEADGTLTLRGYCDVGVEP